MTQIEFCQKQAFLNVLDGIDIVAGQIQPLQSLQIEWIIHFWEAILLANELCQTWPEFHLIFIFSLYATCKTQPTQDHIDLGSMLSFQISPGYEIFTCSSKAFLKDGIASKLEISLKALFSIFWCPRTSLKLKELIVKKFKLKDKTHQTFYAIWPRKRQLKHYRIIGCQHDLDFWNMYSGKRQINSLYDEKLAKSSPWSPKAEEKGANKCWISSKHPIHVRLSSLQFTFENPSQAEVDKSQLLNSKWVRDLKGKRFTLVGSLQKMTQIQLIVK